MTKCTTCGSSQIKRCSRQDVGEHALGLLGFYPHRCRVCMQRRNMFVWTKVLAPALVMMLGATVLLAGGYVLRSRTKYSEAAPRPIARVQAEAVKTSAQQIPAVKSPDVIDNQSIVDMTKSDISERLVIRLIERSSCRFDLSPAALIRMKNSGVSEEILQAMVANVDQCSEAEPGPQRATAGLRSRIPAALPQALLSPVQ